MQELGGEFGTVTGRRRRCGWLDLVALRYAVRLNGITSLALTKLDVLSSFAEVPVCVAYRLRDGSETFEFPAHQTTSITAVLCTRRWPAGRSRSRTACPTRRARTSISWSARSASISLVGTGAERERVVALR